MKSVREKIDARSRRTLDEAPPGARVEALVRVRRRPATKTLDAIRDAGLEITAQVGPIVSGSARADAVEQIAGVEGVRSVQLSRVVYPEPDA